MSNQAFIQAAKMKIRFPSTKGALSVEDLFDLPLSSNTGRANLDDIAKTLHRQLKDDSEVSFVDDAKTADSEVSLGFEIVKLVIAMKKEERTANAAAAEKSATRQKIMALIDQKKDAAMGEKSVDELMTLLNTL